MTKHLGNGVAHVAGENGECCGCVAQRVFELGERRGMYQDVSSNHWAVHTGAKSFQVLLCPAPMAQSELYSMGVCVGLGGADLSGVSWTVTAVPWKSCLWLAQSMSR